MKEVEENTEIIPDVRIFGEIRKIRYEQFEGEFAHKNQRISTNMRTIGVMEWVDCLNERRKAKSANF